MAKRDDRHIIIDAVKQAIVCENCGQQESFKLPQSVDEFLAWGKVFMKKHRYCRPDTHNDTADVESLVRKLPVKGSTVDQIGESECP